MEEYNLCVICQECITTEDVKTTKCEHSFHSECYVKYLEHTNKNECPICRQSLGENVTKKNEPIIIHDTIPSEMINGRLIIRLPTSGFISPNTMVEIPREFFMIPHLSLLSEMTLEMMNRTIELNDKEDENEDEGPLELD